MTYHYNLDNLLNNLQDIPEFWYIMPISYRVILWPRMIYPAFPCLNLNLKYLEVARICCLILFSTWPHWMKLHHLLSSIFWFWSWHIEDRWTCLGGFGCQELEFDLKASSNTFCILMKFKCLGKLRIFYSSKYF